MSIKKPFTHTWGLSQDEWDAARLYMQNLLAETARQRATITYGECAQRVFGGRFSPRSTALAQMLEEVCTIEDAQRGIMLGSLVVRKDSGIPGDGYFAFAQDGLGRPVGESPDARRAFWQTEVDRVWASFAR